MRRKFAWLKTLALFALVLAQVLTSVLALAQKPTCKMACCAVTLQLTAPAPSECHSKATLSGHCTKHSSAKAAVGPQGTKCQCKVSSGAQTEQPPIVLGSSHKTSVDKIDAILNTASLELPNSMDFGREPAFFGADSGPPVSRPHCACLGRAPPVFLA